MGGFSKRRDPLLVGMTAATLLGGYPDAAYADALGGYAWEYRPLFIYAPSEAAPGLEAQRAALTPYLDAMRERDMVWIEVVGENVTGRLGAPPDKSAAALRDMHDVSADGVQTVLVGKDTEIKLRSDTPVGPETLFGLIDSMPMRQAEIRARALRDSEMIQKGHGEGPGEGPGEETGEGPGEETGEETGEEMGEETHE